MRTAPGLLVPGADVADIPLHFTFQGQERDDIIRFTDLNTEGTVVGSDFAGDSFLITPNQQVTAIRCPGY